MITWPRTSSDAVAALQSDAAGARPALRAGGTDLQHRRGLGLSTGPVVSLRDTTDLNAVAWREQRLAVGAGLRVQALADDPVIRRCWPALASAAGGLATPQIRAVATVGGNLLQRNRCWYFRNPAFPCLKKGGATCFAREGEQDHHACFDLGPCVAVHPSTLGLALLAYDAEVEVFGKGARSVAALYGDGTNARNDHTLGPDELLSAVLLPAPLVGEQSAYFRLANRVHAEWPLIDVVARLKVEAGKIAAAWVAVGAVAPIPLRMPEVEAALVGKPPEDMVFQAASMLSVRGARPLAQTAYKVDLLPAVVADTLRLAVSQAPIPDHPTLALPSGG